MITPENNSRWIYNDHWTPRTFYGLSTDTKPTEHIINGSVFIEMDSSKIYFFDQAGEDWIPWGVDE